MPFAIILSVVFGICIFVVGCARQKTGVTSIDTKPAASSVYRPKATAQSEQPKSVHYSPDEAKAIKRINEKWDAILGETSADLEPSSVTLLVNLDAAGNVTSTAVKNSNAAKPLEEIC